MNWNAVYEREMELDAIYARMFGDSEEVFRKNCISLIAEIGEFTNETKVFKYWSSKKPDKEKVLEEFADVIMQLFYFFNRLKIEDITYTDKQLSKDIIFCFNELFKISTDVLDNLSEDVIRNIFAYIVHIGLLLDLTEEEMQEACFKKIKKQEERLEVGY